MNKSHVRHFLYALAMQAAIGLPTGNWWAGAAFASAWFVSREHAQRELQIGIARGLASVEQLAWWHGFTGWDRDRWLDAGCPALACLIVPIAWRLLGGGGE